MADAPAAAGIVTVFEGRSAIYAISSAIQWRKNKFIDGNNADEAPGTTQLMIVSESTMFSPRLRRRNLENRDNNDQHIDCEIDRIEMLQCLTIELMMMKERAMCFHEARTMDLGMRCLKKAVFA